MELNRDQVVRKLVINPLVRRLRASYERIFHQIESRESELTLSLRSLQECISLPREELGASLEMLQRSVAMRLYPFGCHTTRNSVDHQFSRSQLKLSYPIKMSCDGKKA